MSTQGRSRFHHPHDRWSDRPFVQRVKNASNWTWDNKESLGRIWLFIISVVVLSTAIRVDHLNKDAKQQRAEAARTAKISATQAYESCQRTLTFGPRLAEIYGMKFRADNGKTFQILTPKQVEAYKATIPKKCAR